MTTRHETGGLRYRLLAASVFAALLAQMALPALHALSEGSALAAAPTWQAASAAAAADASVAPPGRAHDPDACPVCRTLMRTSPLATPPAASGAACPERAPVAPALPVCAAFTVVLTGHPPRAPPA